MFCLHLTFSGGPTSNTFFFICPDGVCFFLDGLCGRFTVDLKIYCITGSGCEI